MNITREAIAAKALLKSIRDLDADDDLALDMVEGETSLLEAFDRLLERMARCEAHIVGTKAVVADIEARAERFKKRIETDRALIEQAMTIAELPKVERPLATISLRQLQPKLIVSDEAEIPARFWKPADPTLDKKALSEALKASEAVPGASLSNAAPTLTIRRN